MKQFIMIYKYNNLIDFLLSFYSDILTRYVYI